MSTWEAKSIMICMCHQHRSFLHLHKLWITHKMRTCITTSSTSHWEKINMFTYWAMNHNNRKMNYSVHGVFLKKRCKIIVITSFTSWEVVLNADINAKTSPCGNKGVRRRIACTCQTQTQLQEYLSGLKTKFFSSSKMRSHVTVLGSDGDENMVAASTCLSLSA